MFTQFHSPFSLILRKPENVFGIMKTSPFFSILIAEEMRKQNKTKKKVLPCYGAAFAPPLSTAEGSTVECSSEYNR